MKLRFKLKVFNNARANIGYMEDPESRYSWYDYFTREYLLYLTGYE